MSRALGRYELLRPLARGGMAEVYLARRRVAGVEKRLVIKRIRPERAGDPRLLELFVREARLSMALAHPNIVPVFDFGRARDELFLAMEHIEGHDLGAALRRAGATGAGLDPLLAAFIAHECCQALDYAHGRRDPDGALLGVVHRDVSPRNVLLSASGAVLLADFGVAALSGDREGRLCGTPAYMAPEQARSEAVDGRADLYALGLVLWEMATGRRARSGDAAAALAEARRGQAPEIPDTVPAGLASIIRRATAASAADRYPGAREMLEELDGFIMSARAARPGLPPPARRLAAWLRELWSAEPDSAEPADAEVTAPLPAVTFLDDGEAELLGHGTVGSMAETVAEEEPAGSLVPAAPPMAAGAEAAAANEPLALIAPPVAPQAAVPVSAPAPARARWPLAAALAALAVIGGGFLFLRGGTSPHPSTEAAPAESAAGRAGPAPSPLATTEPAAPASPGADFTAEVPAAEAIAAEPIATEATAAGAPAATAPAAVGQPSPRPPRAGRPPHAPTPVAADPSASRRNVTVGASPWAYFYVDGDRTQHQTPETVQLSPGRHTLRFENPELRATRTVPIDVPADRDLRHVEVLTPP